MANIQKEVSPVGQEEEIQPNGVPRGSAAHEA